MELISHGKYIILSLCKNIEHSTKKFVCFKGHASFQKAYEYLPWILACFNEYL
jgi:hypothetical protein